MEFWRRLYQAAITVERKYGGLAAVLFRIQPRLKIKLIRGKIKEFETDLTKSAKLVHYQGELSTAKYDYQRDSQRNTQQVTERKRKDN